MRGMTAAEQVVGWATGKALVWLGKRAADRKDWHEYNHCLAALTVGDSDHEGECAVPRDKHIRISEWTYTKAQR